MLKSKIYYVILAFLFFSQFAFAQSSCPSKDTAAGLKKICQEVAPECFADLEGEGTPEEKIKKITAGISDQELMARLVFAESMASHCMGSSEQPGIVQGIGWVITNRYRSHKKQFGIGREVVTKAQQFRSSLGTYDVAQRKSFLCPSESGASWKQVWAQSQEAVKAGVANKGNPAPDSYHYYLHEHFKGSSMEAKYYGKLPGWAAAPAEKVSAPIPGLQPESKCLTLYHKVK